MALMNRWKERAFMPFSCILCHVLSPARINTSQLNVQFFLFFIFFFSSSLLFFFFFIFLSVMFSYSYHACHSLVKLPEVKATMTNMAREMMRAGMIEEMVDDTMSSMDVRTLWTRSFCLLYISLCLFYISHVFFMSSLCYLYVFFAFSSYLLMSSLCLLFIFLCVYLYVAVTLIDLCIYDAVGNRVRVQS